MTTTTTIVRAPPDITTTTNTTTTEITTPTTIMVDIDTVPLITNMNRTLAIMETIVELSRFAVMEPSKSSYVPIPTPRYVILTCPPAVFSIMEESVGVISSGECSGYTPKATAWLTYKPTSLQFVPVICSAPALYPSQSTMQKPSSVNRSAILFLTYIPCNLLTYLK